MKLLLDTHIFLWSQTDDPRLTGHFRQAMSFDDNQVFVSAVSVWEIAIKRASGKLTSSDSAVRALREHPKFTALDITPEHAERAGALPVLHLDPFDRLLVAQAQLEGMVLVSVDEQILRYRVPHL